MVMPVRQRHVGDGLGSYAFNAGFTPRPFQDRNLNVLRYLRMQSSPSKTSALAMITIIHIRNFKWCPGAESNHRHEDFQSTALPLSYPGTGMTSSSGRRVLGGTHRGVQCHFAKFSNAAVRGRFLPHHQGLLPSFLRHLRPATGSRSCLTATLPNQCRHSVSNRRAETLRRFRDHRSGKPS